MIFKDFGLSQQLITAIKRLGFNEPTQIQEKSIPHIIKGRDVIGESATGSGKTLAFGCSIVENVVPNQGLQALIMTPTRELAEQVRGSLKDLSSQKNIRVISIYGGVSINPQIDALARAEVVVATPGRLLDHLERTTINLSKIKVLVLDEADRMFDMGFIEDVERIIQHCPKKRQTLFFSATISDRIVDLANNYMTQPVKVSATVQVDPSKLKQVYYDVQRNMRLSLLVHLLNNENTSLAMVFCNTRHNVDFVQKNLRANGVNAISIHGGLTQNKRSKTIEMFNKGRMNVLVCTDVAARGLHIENVSHVYNYDIPKDATDYVHRIGRTARAGEDGKVINLLCDYDYDNFSRVLAEYPMFKIDSIKKPYCERIIANTGAGNSRRPFGRGQGRGQSRGQGPRGQSPRMQGQRSQRGSRSRTSNPYNSQSHSSPSHWS